MIRIGPDDPRAPDCVALLGQHHALMQSLFPAEANHFLEVDALAGPDIRFLSARESGSLRGVGALALRDGYGEIKSMFTAPEARAQGIGDAILSALIETAASEGLDVLRLETGRGLDAAHRLYARHGFVPRGPFGAYEAGPHSLFFERGAPA
ncbi:GNAT family N-acetyltransferase [Jannaschia seohaensis]|uniref:Putative acetyltransferase n=1 Tax=Jannaschia seohaensis TaxID=475081 RepID=A0A2Y9A5I2_9RHOB|nr:GNAT family N-acetyltransferase [Jannaschia seohaensis]PWJ22430.1 putative acetyltransferase [Jannaschia seohaensis]SSA38708.1 putative acetyltransferase [Jannaschia seohaensis]